MDCVRLRVTKSDGFGVGGNDRQRSKSQQSLICSPCVRSQSFPNARSAENTFKRAPPGQSCRKQDPLCRQIADQHEHRQRYRISILKSVAIWGHSHRLRSLTASNPSVQRKQALTLCNVENTTRYQGIETMRLIVSALITAAIGLAASQASAADLPRKAPAYVPPAPPPITWTGCYIGANVGGRFGPAGAIRCWRSRSDKAILALPGAVKLAAIINSLAHGCSASAICLMGQA